MDNKGHLLNRIEATTGLPEEKAEPAVEAVLRQLHDRLGPEASDLEAQLPEDVKPMFTGGVMGRMATLVKPDAKWGWQTMVETVCDGAELDQPTAKQLIESVFHELKDHVTDGQARHVASVLPGDIQAVWERA